MSIAHFYQALRLRWRAFANSFWPEDPRRRAEEALERLTAELGRRQQGLLRRRRHIERLRGRVGEAERRIARQVTRLESGAVRADPDAAWQAALELDDLRRAAARLGRRLRRHEQAYQGQRLAFARRKRRSLELRAALRSGRDAPLAGARG